MQSGKKGGAKATSGTTSGSQGNQAVVQDAKNQHLERCAGYAFVRIIAAVDTDRQQVRVAPQ